MQRPLVLATGGVIGFFASWYLYRKYKLRYFKRLGIPGPEPNWFFGNIRSLAEKEFSLDAILDWTRKYGSVFGFYQASEAILVVSDLEIARTVGVKHSRGAFHSRQPLPLFPHPDSEFVHTLIANGSRWKRLSSQISPSFTISKLSNLIPTMSNAADQVVIEPMRECELEDRPVDANDLFQRLSLHTICECAFGLVVDNTNDYFLVACRKAFADLIVRIPKRVLFYLLFPEVRDLFTSCYVYILLFAPLWLHGDKLGFLIELMAKIVQKRSDERKQGKGLEKHDILTELLKNRQVSSYKKIVASAENGDEMCSETKNLTTPNEVTAQCFVLLTAGYETTSNTLSCITQMLATRPAVQKKLREDISAHGTDSKYLDWVIHETLRLYPIATQAVARVATENVTISENLTIEKGTVVMINTWWIHRDPSIWGNDAEQFRPERWNPENSDVSLLNSAFLAFGIGPRACVGLRFAMQEMKLTLIKIFTKFRVVPGPSFDYDNTLISKTLVQLKHPVNIKLEVIKE